MAEGASRQPARRTGAVLSGSGVEREVPVCATSERSGVAGVVGGGAEMDEIPELDLCGLEADLYKIIQWIDKQNYGKAKSLA